jgi:hypothetical protein
MIINGDCIVQRIFSLTQIDENFSRQKCSDKRARGSRKNSKKKSWLKQLRVAVSTKASMPSVSSPQNSKTNFVDLRRNI